MFIAPNSSRYGDLTVEQARVMRANQARLASLYADRVEQAQAAAESRAVARWTHEYRRSTLTCRLLGERIRGERCESPPAKRARGSSAAVPAIRSAHQQV